MPMRKPRPREGFKDSREQLPFHRTHTLVERKKRIMETMDMEISRVLPRTLFASLESLLAMIWRILPRFLVRGLLSFKVLSEAISTASWAV